MYVCMYVCMCVYKKYRLMIYMYICICVCVCICICICKIMYIYIYVYVYVYVYVYIYIYTHRQVGMSWRMFEYVSACFFVYTDWYMLINMLTWSSMIFASGDRNSLHPLKPCSTPELIPERKNTTAHSSLSTCILKYSADT